MFDTPGLLLIGAVQLDVEGKVVVLTTADGPNFKDNRFTLTGHDGPLVKAVGSIIAASLELGVAQLQSPVEQTQASDAQRRTEVREVASLLGQSPVKATEGFLANVAKVMARSDAVTIEAVEPREEAIFRFLCKHFKEQPGGEADSQPQAA